MTGVGGAEVGAGLPGVEPWVHLFLRLSIPDREYTHVRASALHTVQPDDSREHLI